MSVTKPKKRERAARRSIPTDAPFLDRNALCRRWGISRATSYRLEASGHLRPPVKLAAGIARWPVAEVEEIERRAAEDRGTGEHP